MLMLLSWLAIAFTQSSLWALLLGVITFDLGLQAVHVTSQSLIYSVRPDAQSRLVAAYMLFYSAGSALGSVLATAACSYLGIKYGWAYGFGLAGIGMTLGLITFILGQSWLEGRGGPPQPEMLKTRKVFGVPFEAVFWIGGLVTVLPVWLLMQRHHIIETALPWLAGVIFKQKDK